MARTTRKAVTDGNYREVRKGSGRDWAEISEGKQPARKGPRGGMLVNDCTARTFGRFKCSCCRLPKDNLYKRMLKRRERKNWKNDIREAMR